MNPIYRRILNEISLDTYGKKFDDLNYTKQSEIVEKAEVFEAAQFNQNEIRKGDYVDFGIYGRAYVLEDRGTYFWVTNVRSDRYNKSARGNLIRKAYARKIIERG